METAVVIPVGANRLDNLLYVLDTISKQTKPVRLVVLVLDGEDVDVGNPNFKVPTAVLKTPKHEPGKEQPRNMGVRLIEDLKAKGNELVEGITHVWFLDTDVIVRERAHQYYAEADAAVPEDEGKRVLIGPYDWLPPGVREPVANLRNDPRWVSFNEYTPENVLRENIAAGLANFSGNLVWPIDEFTRVGGFWDEMHHGRCEDGELGLRAVAMGVPMSFVPEARGWHLDHPRNNEWIVQTNAIDVPKINERHPWVEGEGLFVVEEDGKRFNCRCPECGEEMNTASIWNHQSQHRPQQMEPVD